ncbi:unnamed protein product, partial [Rotaria socialis]
QLSYTPFKGSYHSSRENSAHRRYKSPKKTKVGHTATKTPTDDGSKHRRKFRSRSPQKQIESDSPITSKSNALTQEQPNQQQQQPPLPQPQPQPQPLPLPQQQIAAWQAVQQMPIIPMGIYNRYVPKAIQLPTGETLKTAIPSLNANGLIVAQIEPQQTGTSKDSLRSSSRSRSISPKRNDSQQHSRALSANNAGASALLIESSHHHHHHHHHRRQPMYDIPYSSSKPDS